MNQRYTFGVNAVPRNVYPAPTPQTEENDSTDTYAEHPGNELENQIAQWQHEMYLNPPEPKPEDFDDVMAQCHYEAYLEETNS